MDLINVYLIALCGAVAVPLFYVVVRIFHNSFKPYVQRSFVLLVHSDLRYFGHISWLHFCIFVFYVGINATILSLGVDSITTLMKNSSRIASANLMLLFLGGKTNPIVDRIQVSLRNYYFAHRAIAIVATSEAFVHAGISLRNESHKPLLISGIVIAGCIVAIIISVVYPGRRLGRFYGKIHVLFSLGVVLGLVWHVLLQPSVSSKIPVFVCCGLWLSTHMYRLIRMFILNYFSARVGQRKQKNDLTLITMNLNKLAPFYPGCYYYIFFNGPLPFYDLFHGYPMMPFWEDSDDVTTEFSFLMSRKGSHGLPLATMDEWKRVRLDGPYGKDHRLQNFETVLLTAKGMGIVGVLPFALHLAKRRRRDDDVRRKEARLRDSNDPVFGDLSRRVDLIWWLEDNDQEVWVSKQLKRLQVLDNKVCLPYRVLYVPDEHSSKSQQRLLVVWCVYPDLRHDKKMPFEANEYWKIRYNFNLQSFSRELRQEARYPGDTVLLSCGDDAFVSTMRKTAVDNTTTERAIKFVEVEFRPGRIDRKAHSSSTYALLSSVKRPPRVKRKGKKRSNHRDDDSFDSETTLIDTHEMSSNVHRKKHRAASRKKHRSPDASDVV